MTPQFYDILVAKEYESKQSGTPERKTAWNRVGRAWTSRSNESISFELYLMPNQRYVISLRDRRPEPETKPEDVSF